MKRFFLLVSFLIGSNVRAMDAIPLEKVGASSISEDRSAILNEILVDQHYISCQSDLKNFIQNLSPKDRQSLKSLANGMPWNKKTKQQLTTHFKKGLQGFKIGKITFDDDFKSISCLIKHDNNKHCLISLFTEQSMDQLKVNPDPSEPDLQFGGLFVERTLMGASYDLRTEELQFDSSKARNILSKFTRDESEINDLLQKLRQAEQRAANLNEAGEQNNQPSGSNQ